MLDHFQALATAPDGKSTFKGTWSTIYDQAFRVELENGMRFAANFKYNIIPELSKDPLADGGNKFEGTQTGDYNSFNSECNKSMVGFVQQVGGDKLSSMKTHHTQCFYALQKQHLNVETSKLETDAEGVKIDRIVSKNPKAVLTAVSDTPKLA
jgi:hypothetical protein